MRQGALRVAIYTRVSTGEQNPELQLRELRDYAERRGFLQARAGGPSAGDDRRGSARGDSGRASPIEQRQRRGVIHKPLAA